MNIVMMGVQGSGKGTQSKLLAEHLALPHISVGDLFRKNISEGTLLGSRPKEYIDRGELVPDGIVIDMVIDRLNEPDANEGFILDGFPRNGVQLAALEYLKPIDHAILLDLDDETAVKRLSSRTECRKCKIIYGGNRKPKQAGICDECGESLIERSDDSDVAAVRKRIDVYHREIDLMVRYYEWKKALRRIPGEHDMATVFDLIKKTVEG